jgi:hypothetical protein
MDNNNNGSSSSSSSGVKAKIMAHPHYHRLLEAYINCQKVRKKKKRKEGNYFENDVSKSN